MSTAIDHCDFTAKIRSKEMSPEDFKEAVMTRAGEIVKSVLKGDNGSKPHKLAGVELVAAAIAREVIQKGAAKVCTDMDADLGALAAHASSVHISSC